MAQAGLESLRLDLEKAEYWFITSSGLKSGFLRSGSIAVHGRF